MDPFVVGIRFQKTGKIYHFDASNCSDIQVGDFAVVDTSRGRQVGEVVQILRDPPPPPSDEPWKPIHHKATPHDLAMRHLWQKKEMEAVLDCRARVAEVGIPGLKIIAAEFTFDGSRLVFLYSTEAEGKVDLRKLQSVMQRIYPLSHVEMRQIGPRDVAKMLGGMGACGLEMRCCARFVTEFSPVSIKMAKEQGISLTPTEITGMCGRLRCCLVYEYDQYVEARKTLPRRNKRVVTPNGEGKVVDVYPLKQVIVVELDSGTRAEFAQADLQPWDEAEVLRRKALESCPQREGNLAKDSRSAESTLHPAKDTQAQQAESLLSPDFQTEEDSQPADHLPSPIPHPSKPGGSAHRKSRKPKRKKPRSPKE